MYKIGDKVETPLGVGVIVDIYSNYEGVYDKYRVRIKNACIFAEIPINQVKPYKSSHGKLIELGYEFTKRNDYAIYTHDDLPRVTIYSDKTYSCSDTNLALSRILTQYLEELEE